MKKAKGLTKGSITVEATFVVGITLMVIFVALSICFYMHNRAWYSAAAGETAITASTYAVRKNGKYQEVIEMKRSAFADGTGFMDAYPEMISNSSGEQIKIVTKVTTPVLMSTRSLEADIDSSSKVIKPVKFIRKIQSLQIIKEQIYGD